MVREHNIAQERRPQLQQQRAYKITKNMAPTSTAYSLRSHGTPTKTVEYPVRVRRVSVKVTENEEVAAT